MTKIVVFAYSLVGHRCLKALIEAGENISCVMTHPDNPDETQWFPSVAKLARDHGIHVLETEGPKDSQVIEAMTRLKPDLLFSFYYRKMIPQEILDIPRLGCFNMHGSLLPQYRGRAPINWALVHGETQTGVTLHHMVKSADAGAMVDQEAIPIGPTDNAYELTVKMGEVAATVLLRQLSHLKEGTAPKIPQDDSKASYFGGRSAKDSEINWHQTPWQIHNLIRAVPYPYFPPAFTHLNNEKIEIRANLLPTGNQKLHQAITPGQVIENNGNFIRVACGDGTDYLDITQMSVPISDISVGDQFNSTDSINKS
jgi:methionyl-tRNA formyltransferase